MKTNRDTAILIVLIFILTLLGSEIFTLMSLNVYGMLSLNYRTQVYSFSPYAELAYLLVGLVVITSIILLLIKYKLGRLMFWMFVVVSFMIMLEFLSMFFIYIFGNFAPDLLSIASIGVYLVTALALVYYYKYAGIFGRNVVNVLMFLTVASILSLALGPIPSLILVGVIAIYDYISVFVTKHMVTLASSMGDNTFLGGITLMAKKAKKKSIPWRRGLGVSGDIGGFLVCKLPASGSSNGWRRRSNRISLDNGIRQEEQGLSGDVRNRPDADTVLRPVSSDKGFIRVSIRILQ